MSLIAEYTEQGFQCAIIKHDEIGHLCGYLGVGPGHPWYGRDDGEIRAEVHGGLTYASHGQVGHPTSLKVLDRLDRKYRGRGPRPTIWRRQHRAERKRAGEPGYPVNKTDDIWWVGFDCNHLGDLAPGMRAFSAEYGARYRDEQYVRGEITRLVDQAHVCVERLNGNSD